MDPNTDCLCTSFEGSQCVQQGIVGSGKGTLQKMQATCIPAKFPGVRDPASPPEDSANVTVVRETISTQAQAQAWKLQHGYRMNTSIHLHKQNWTRFLMTLSQLAYIHAKHLTSHSQTFRQHLTENGQRRQTLGIAADTWIENSFLVKVWLHINHVEKAKTGYECEWSVWSNHMAHNFKESTYQKKNRNSIDTSQLQLPSFHNC